MLKSTHRPVTKASDSVLPEGWTEHKAPTGHTYYYNAATKVSTYKRPEDPLNPATDIEHAASVHSITQGSADSDLPRNLNVQPGHAGFVDRTNQTTSSSRFRREPNHTRPQHRDRPKAKVAIPGSEPWVLVTTRLSRRFVHNPETSESFWRFPPDVLKNVIELDRQNREKRQKTEHVASQELAPAPEPTASLPPTAALPSNNKAGAETKLDSDEEYEEVEVTDDDGESEKQETVEGNSHNNQPVDFDEDDIAYQLRAMGEDYGLDPGEYGDEDFENAEDGAEGLPLSEEDAKALFKDLLVDYQVSPFTTWDALIDAGNIIEDDRYVALPNMRARKEVWAEWSKEEMHRIKEKRALEAKKDPKIPYFELLEARATPKLYWPEFRRKYQKEPEMRNTKLLDKDKEKWYRDYINRLKLPEQTLKADFVALLKSLPIHALNKSTTLESLPPAMLTDLRLISLRSPVRNPMIEAHVRTLGPAPVNPELSAEEAQQAMKYKAERDRRENALTERQKLVDQDKKRQEGALRFGRGMLRDGEDELQRAKQVSKQGLLGHLARDENSPE